MAGIALRIVEILRQHFAGAAVAKIRRGRNLTITRVTRYKMANRLVFQIDFYERLFRRERVFRDRTMPLDIYDERELVERYRFGRAHLMLICAALEAQLAFGAERLGGTPPIIQLLITLRILACGGFQLDAGDLFGLAKCTVGRLFHRVVGVLAARLRQSAR